MKALVITPEPPTPPTSGGQLRVCQQVAGLQAVGYQVTVLAFAEPDNVSGGTGRILLGRETTVAKLSRFLRAAVRGEHPHLLRLLEHRDAVVRALYAHRPDLVVLEYSVLAPLLPAIRAALPGVVTVVDTHNAETVLLAQLLRASRRLRPLVRHLLEWRGMARIERTFLPLADEVWVPSEADGRALQTLGARRIAVVPNGVNTAYYQPGPAGADDPVLVFSGIFHHAPNVEAAEILCRQILPRVVARRPEVRVCLVGKSPGAIRHLKGPRVTITGFVPDVRPYLARAAIAVVPLRRGAGTRLKILEALAMGKAVVSTHKGCEGLHVKDGIHLLMAETAEEFTDRIVALLVNPSWRRRLGDAGRELVQREYSWEAVHRILRTGTIAGRL
jgi:glycosyltransferase involved in cell wall biosynthesis